VAGGCPRLGKSGGSSWPVGVLDLGSQAEVRGRWVSSTCPTREVRRKFVAGGCPRLGKSGGSSWPVGVLDRPTRPTHARLAHPLRMAHSPSRSVRVQNSGFRGAKMEEAARIASSLFDRSGWRAAGIQAENSGDRCLARPSRPISTTSSSPRQSQPGTNEGQRHWPRNRA
jgi:hypothetical protein